MARFATTSADRSNSILLVFEFIGLFGLSVAQLELTAQARADTLDPIIVRGATPGDVLSEDPIVPGRQATILPDRGRGSIGRTLGDELPMATFESATPGGISQFRALGRSAEDVDVQALGVPLNGPQGGGFDYSIFPQFIWAGYRFQPAPSLSAFDPRGVGGSMVLTPWTQAALGERRDGGGAGFLYSDAGLRQYFAAATFPKMDDERAIGGAVVLGVSQGRARGPSGALAITRAFGSDASLTLHLLATDLEVDVPGASSLPTPLAKQTTRRVIPLLQFDSGIGAGEEGLLKVSAFYDSTYFRNDNPDPDFPDVSRLKATQAGFESVVLAGVWRAGLSLRRVDFSEEYIEPASSGFVAPSENLLNLQLTRSGRFGAWRLDPTAQLSVVGAAGALPAGSLGARRAISAFPSAPLEFYSRFSVSRRVANLVDRYYATAYFRGNPALAPETDWTLLAGVQTKARTDEEWGTDLQAYAQLREDAQVGRAGPPATVVNAGSARVLGLTHSIDWRPSRHWAIASSVAWTTSFLSDTATDFPYLPRLTQVLRLIYRSGPGELTAAARFATSALAAAETGDRVAAYGYLDVGARIGADHFEVSGRLENVFDRRYEQIRDFPAPGRAVVISLRAVL